MVSRRAASVPQTSALRLHETLQQLGQFRDVNLRHLQGVIFRQLFLVLHRRNDAPQFVKCSVQSVHPPPFSGISGHTSVFLRSGETLLGPPCDLDPARSDSAVKDCWLQTCTCPWRHPPTRVCSGHLRVSTRGTRRSSRPAGHCGSTSDVQ